MEKKIRVAICDDAESLSQGFKVQLSKGSDIEIVATVSSAEECVNMVENKTPDVLLLDARMKTDSTGIDTVDDIKDVSSDTKIIMLTHSDDENDVFDAFATGVDDYCFKDADVNIISEKIHNVYKGISQIAPNILKKLMKKTQENKKQNSILMLYNQISLLTAGEFELLSEMYHGGTYKKIAEKKGVDIESLRKMAQRVLAKFEISNMKELILSVKQLKFFETLECKNN